MMKRGREGDGGKRGEEGESARERELCQRGGCTSYRNTQRGKSAQRENQTDTTRRTKNKTKQKKNPGYYGYYVTDSEDVCRDCVD